MGGPATGRMVQRWQPSSCNTRLYNDIGSNVCYQIMIERAGPPIAADLDQSLPVGCGPHYLSGGLVLPLALI
jgi:hypothetical protein